MLFSMFSAFCIGFTITSLLQTGIYMYREYRAKKELKAIMAALEEHQKWARMNDVFPSEEERLRIMNEYNPEDKPKE